MTWLVGRTGAVLVKIGLLGSLYVVTRDGGVRFTAGQQRAVIARLAAEPGKLVPVGELVAAVWGQSPPSDGRGAVRTLVCRARDRLGGDGGLVVTEEGAYRLEAEPDDVDMVVFERLCKAGLAAAVAGDWRGARGTLAEAEGLWRGAPFADVPSETLREAHVPHLERQLLTARQCRLEASVRLSVLACDAAADELARLAGAHPDRERLRWLLMLALYRAGRRKAAQDCYFEYRAYSSANFGVAPGEDIKALGDRIAVGDPALTAEPFG
jgi:DNA-binding SARP family transcriptional activator